MTIMGSLQWFDLLNRGKLAVYDSIYAFELSEQPDMPRPLPQTARSELFASVALATFWSADLSREFLPFISATDASTEFGFGVAVANTGLDVVRRVATFAEKRGDYVVLGDSVLDKPVLRTKARLGTARCLDLSQKDFKTVLSVRARHKAHNNLLEADAYLLWLRWLLRNKHHHSSRAVCLVDSKVVLYSVAKGRSSSRPLLRILRRIAALQLAGNLMTRLIFIPTEFNPSDLPSRGVRTRDKNRGSRNKLRNDKVNTKKLRYAQRLTCEIERSPCREELWDLLDGDPTFWEFKKRQG